MHIETGEYELHIPSYEDKRIYYTFIPKPLQGIDVKVDDEMYILLNIAYKRLAMLEGMSKYAPNIDIIQTYILRKEIYSSLKIDNDKIKLHEVISGRYKKSSDADSVEDYLKAIDYSMNKKFCIENICKAHEMLLYGEHPNAGQLRVTQTFISQLIHDNTTKVYNPTAPQHIKQALQKIEDYAKVDDKLDYLIKIALIHYQFEVIHPFETGNGIIGRLLMPWMLSKKSIMSKPLLSVSEQLLLNKESYFSKIRRVESLGEYLEWIKFIIEQIAIAAEQNIKTIDSLETMIKENKDRIERMEGSANSNKSVYGYFLHNPITGVNEVAEAIGISFNTTAKIFEKLREAGIISQYNNQTRHRQFVFDGLINNLCSRTD